MMGSAVGGRLPRTLRILLGVCVALGACAAPSDVAPATKQTSPVASAPATPAVASPAPSTASSPAPVKPTVSKAGLAYFFAVAFGAEYGDDISVVTKWNKAEVTVRVHGGATKSKDCVSKVISDFNAITKTTDLKLTAGAADIEFYFAPVSKFRSIESHYVSGNDGFFYMSWSGSYVITSANVLIRSSGISERIRCHLIREVLTQAMGLAKDSNKYPNSVFYGKYSPAPTRYSKLDEEIIRLLYSGAVYPGDDKKSITERVTVK